MIERYPARSLAELSNRAVPAGLHHLSNRGFFTILRLMTAACAASFVSTATGVSAFLPQAEIS